MTFRASHAAALIAIALKQPDPAERAAWLEILRKDGWV